MMRCILAALLCLAFALLLPVAAPRLTAALAPDVGPGNPETGAVREEDAVPAALILPGADRRASVTLLRNGRVTEMTLAEYLPGVLAGEMPAGFEPQALRAQAVAARTFAVFHARRGTAAHPEAALCADPACCQVWLGEDELRDRWGEGFEANMARIRSAVEDTDGVCLTYGGEPILACFHSSSPGQTENSAAVWGTSLPYLVSVDSPETAADVPDFISTVEIAPEDFREVILSAYPRCAITEALPPDWLGSRTLDTGGRVASIRVGGTPISGTKMRSLFSLRSACFDLVWTGHSFLFTVTGYGHGAGMSQYGANVMAREGQTWPEILAHYYPGTRLDVWEGMEKQIPTPVTGSE